MQNKPDQSLEKLSFTKYTKFMHNCATKEQSLKYWKNPMYQMYKILAKLT